jgi:hypothetical protein
MTARLYGTEQREMTEKDRLVVGAAMAKRDLEIEALKEERTAVVRVYRVKLKELEDTRHALSTSYDEGVLEERFEVVEVPDDGRFLIQIMRKDTSELWKTRTMTEGERETARRRMQGDLFEGDDTEPPPPAPRLPRTAKKNGKAKRS